MNKSNKSNQKLIGINILIRYILFNLKMKTTIIVISMISLDYKESKTRIYGYD